MANPDRPNGFRASPLGSVSVYQGASDASAMYPGDMCILESTGEADVSVAGSTGLVGAAVSYLAAGADTGIRICDDPSQAYIGQDDGSATPTLSNVGNNADIVATAGDSTLKQSRQEIDASDLATSASQLRMLEIIAHPEYAIGVNSLWKCVLNEHYLRTTTGI